MLEGVNVLYSYTQTTGMWSVWGAWIAFILFAVASVYAWFLVTRCKTKSHLVVALLCTILCFGLMLVAFSTTTETEVLHKVTIEDTVSYVEFTYYYEVVNIEGEIYTIREITHEVSEIIPPAPTETTSPIDPTWDTSAVG